MYNCNVWTIVIITFSLDGPSHMQLEIPSPNKLCKPVPIAPPVNTTGLSGIIIQLKCPVITQQLIIGMKVML